MKKLQHKTSPF